MLFYFQLATRVCPAKPSRRNPKPPRPNHATTDASPSVDPGCYAGNSSSFPVVHGIATAVEHYARDLPHDPTITALKRNLQLNVNWRGHGTEPLATQAPLASPEPLSETSSLASYGSDSFRRQLSGDRRWVCRTAVRMDPIRQSPLCRPSPPSTRLVLSNSAAGSGVATGLCFPVEEMQHSDEPGSDQDSAVCPDMQTVPAAVQPASMCQTVVEVHHHQDSPTQNEASKSMSDFVSEQTDDNISAVLLADTPSVQAVSSVGEQQLFGDARPDDCSVADNHCLHAATGCSNECKCRTTAGVDELEKVVGDGQLCQLPHPSPTECRSHVNCDTSDHVSVVDPELDF